jgi:hypothetical protein
MNSEKRRYIFKSIFQGAAVNSFVADAMCGSKGQLL